MSIQRVPSVPFAQIANSALRDARLSFKARGILAMVLSNIGEWSATERWITEQSLSDGRASVQTALKELTDLGYRVVSKESDGSGGIQTVVTWYHIPEDPILRPMRNTTVEEIDRRKTGPSIEDHPSEEHISEEQEELFPYPRISAESAEEAFAEFYKAYPRKKQPGRAEAAFKKAIKKTDPAVIIAGAVQFRQWCEQDDKDPTFIPYPSSWLNAKSWLDERDPEPLSNMDKHRRFVSDLAAETGYNSHTTLHQIEGGRT